ncbi:ROK family protein [Phytohabitans kaempferiae]|uniref:ROK family protein n=1 Tax=Phytohabitans kaempferiae TaxID=1620943 RepID=A0ABV6MG44_9ACTN
MSRAVVALDVGGTGIKSALVSESGAVLHTERHATGAARGPDAVVETILDLAESLAGKARADGLTPVAAGVTVPGVVDEAAGVAAWSANVGFRDVPLRDLVSARLGLPAALGHDVRAGGLAEARLGSGRDFRQVLFVAIGTGIAAAHVVDGKGFSGAHGAAGELGHIVVRPGGTICGCGARGCLEAEASAAGVSRRYATATSSAATAAEVVALAAAGDAAATEVWSETVEVLADGLVTAQTLYDVEAMVLGGGLAEAGDALLVPLRVAIRARLRFQAEPALVRAALGDEAGCVGAALLALDARA